MRKTLSTTAALGLVVLLAGCGGDDPAAPAATPTLQLDAADAEEWTLASLEMVNGLVTAVPSFAAGDFSTWSTGTAAKVADEPVWDPARQAWVYSFAGPVLEMDPPNHFLATIELWVQYRGGGQPVQYPLGADVMEIAASYGLDMHVDDGEQVGDLDYMAEMTLLVSDLGQGDSFAVAGSGSNAVEVSSVTPQASERGRFDVAWTVDLDVPASGCAAGTAQVQTQGWTLDAVYDGQGGVGWTLTGPGYSGEGVDTLACGLAR